MTAQAALSAWLRLTLTPGIGGETQRLLLAAFGVPEDIFNLSASALERVIPASKVHRLLEHDASAAIDRALTWATEPQHHILTLDDKRYPQNLLETHDPPSLLYVIGQTELLQRPTLAIVGARTATPQGVANAEAFATNLSNARYTVVSGLALGIDTAAHRGGLKGRGSTIAVIGTGIDRVYPAGNRKLAHEIAENGAIVSELPLGTPATAANFPRRNRIIAGLAKGCLVVEAALESGSLITARLAAEQGREVFAIPGSIHSPLSKGCHSLIKQGAKLVDDVKDILEELGGQTASPTPTQLTIPHANEPSDTEHDALLNHMGYDPFTVDELCERSGLAADALFAILLPMEIEGLIAKLPGGQFQRITR